MVKTDANASVFWLRGIHGALHGAMCEKHGEKHRGVSTVNFTRLPNYFAHSQHRVSMYI